MNERMKK